MFFDDDRNGHLKDTLCSCLETLWTWSKVPSKLWTEFHNPGICSQRKSGSVSKQLLPPRKYSFYKPLVVIWVSTFSAITPTSPPATCSTSCSSTTIWSWQTCCVNWEKEWVPVINSRPCDEWDLMWQICPKCCASWVPLIGISPRQDQTMWRLCLLENTEEDRKRKDRDLSHCSDWVKTRPLLGAACKQLIIIIWT